MLLLNRPTEIGDRPQPMPRIVRNAIRGRRIDHWEDTASLLTPRADQFPGCAISRQADLPQLPWNPQSSKPPFDISDLSLATQFCSSDQLPSGLRYRDHTPLSAPQ
jgi:hypothetical protein